jgi:hypothetical protein
MTEQHTPSPRSRLQALLAIPDNQRSEEQWDELHELEITLAPGNRIGHQEKQNPLGGQGKGGGGRGGNPRGGGHKGENRGEPRGEARGENRNGGGRGNHPPRPPRPIQPRSEAAPTEGGQEAPAGDAPAGDAPAKKPFRRFHKRPPKPAPASE